MRSRPSSIKERRFFTPKNAAAAVGCTPEEFLRIAHELKIRPSDLQTQLYFLKRHVEAVRQCWEARPR